MHPSQWITGAGPFPRRATSQRQEESPAQSAGWRYAVPNGLSPGQASRRGPGTQPNRAGHKLWGSSCRPAGGWVWLYAPSTPTVLYRTWGVTSPRGSHVTRTWGVTSPTSDWLVPFSKGCGHPSHSSIPKQSATLRGWQHPSRSKHSNL